MHYFDDAADLLRAHPTRRAGQLLLDGGTYDEPRPRPVRQARPEAEPLPTTGGGGGRGPRRPRLLEGVRGGTGPAWRTEEHMARPAEDRPARPGEQVRQAGDRAARIPGELASVHALKVFSPPSARPSMNGHSEQPQRRATRPYRRVGRGLAITPRVSVILPVMNEAANLPGVFASIPDWVDEVVLVDGRSTDNSIAVAMQLRPDVRVVLQGGMGKGDALVAGFAAATGDMVVAIDGDGSTDGAEIVRFVSALMSGADFAKGSRFGSAGDSDDITPFRRFGNKMLNRTVNRLFKTSFTDLCYGYNAFWTRHLPSLGLDSPGFEVETLMSIRAAEAGLRIYEVPSHERLRQHGASNLSAIKDGWRIMRLIVSEKRAARRRRAQQRRAAKRIKANKPRPFMAPGYVAQSASVQSEQLAAIESSRRNGAGLVSVANGSARSS
jgi:Glycosyl transferase family 2